MSPETPFESPRTRFQAPNGSSPSWPSSPSPDSRPVTSRLRTLALLAALVVVAVPALLDVPGISRPARWLLGLALTLGLIVLVWRLSRAFLYKVGRRLAFSYFLLGVLPIPMVALLLAITAYLLAGSFLGHLYRDGVGELSRRLETRARSQLEAPVSRRGEPIEDDSGALNGSVALATYRGGRRVAGDPRAPETWPDWAQPDVSAASEGVGSPTARSPLLLFDDDRPTLAAAAGDGSPGVIAFLDADLERTLSESTDVLVRMALSEEPDEPAMELSIGGRGTVLKTLRPEAESDEEAERFFAERSGDAETFGDVEGTGDLPWIHRPVIEWGLLGGPRARFSDGTALAEYTPVSLVTSPYQLYRHLFAASAELDAYAWVGLLGLAGALFWIYFSAALMAIFLIYGLSSAVNRLSEATAKVQEGEFSVRIPVSRRDQVGDLQRSFNAMTANLEHSVAAAAQKELLDKELAIARDLQQSLVPRDLPRGDRVEFAALFEPSAAIGGDYFDILRLSEDRLAVVIADVSGHGLPTGLRMAMLKAALSVLIEKAERPEEILHRLDALVRSEDDRRFFVTATLALMDLATGELTLLNAGHPPTYVLRGAAAREVEEPVRGPSTGRVDEILLPGSPLGAIGHSFGKERRRLAPGDVVVWLSDGLIEATDGDDEPFGYQRVLAALEECVKHSTAGEPLRPAMVRPEMVKERLLAAVREHTGDRSPADDLTLVVMRWNGPERSPQTSPGKASQTTVGGGGNSLSIHRSTEKSQ